MTTPVITCGFECGLLGYGHVAIGAGPGSISTTTFRNGGRALRIHPASQPCYGYFGSDNVAVKVCRVAVKWDVLPNAKCQVATTEAIGPYVWVGAWFNPADSKIYAGVDVDHLGATGVAVATGQWYAIDFRANLSANPWLIDVRVNGVPCGQLSYAAAATTANEVFLGNIESVTQDAYYDDFLLSDTAADFPLGDGKVLGFMLTSDGSHNVSGTNFIRNAAGTTILITDTNVYTLVDETPMGQGSDFVNQAKTAATEYVEHCFANTAEASPPRGVEVLLARHEAGTQTCASTFKLRDNLGGIDDVVLAHNGAGNTTLRYTRKHYPQRPGGLGAWTVAAFNDLRFRFGFSTDATPDVYFDGVIIEAEWVSGGALQTLIPDPVQAPAAIPSATIIRTKTVIPNAVTASASLPSALIILILTILPVLAPTVVPDATIIVAQLDQTIEPTPAVAVTAVPAPVMQVWLVSGGYSEDFETTLAIVLTCDPVIAPTSVPNIALAFGTSILMPSPIQAAAAIPAPILVFGPVTLVPEPQAAIASTPTITILQAGGEFVVQALPATVIANVPSCTILSGAMVLALESVVAKTTIPDVSIAITPPALTPSPVVTVAAIPNLTLVVGDINLTPDSIIVDSRLPASDIVRTLALLPTPMGAAAVVPMVTISQIGSTVYPTPTVGIASVPSCTMILGILILIPDPIIASAAIPTIAATTTPPALLPTPAMAIAAVPDPTLVMGAISLTPSSVTAISSTPVPVMIATLTLLPDPLAAPIGVPIVTIVQVGGALFLLPTPAVATSLAPSPTMTFGAITLTPSVTVNTAAVPDSIVVVGLTPSPVAALAGIPTPTITMGMATLALIPAIAQGVVPAPTIVVPGIHKVSIIGSVEKVSIVGSVDNHLVLVASDGSVISIIGSV